MQLRCIPSLLYYVLCVYYYTIPIILYVYDYYRYLPIPAHIQMQFVRNVSHQMRI